MASEFKQKVEYLVSHIPVGQVMTYGQIAAICGSPRSARIVGGIAHFGNPELPWHRVVNWQGGLASGYPGGRKAHKLHLEAEGIIFILRRGSYFVDLAKFIWKPNNKEII